MSRAPRHDLRTPDGRRAFPPGFTWGAGTSSYQVEGAIDEDGRGVSIWDTLCARPGAIANGDTGALAADQYHRYPEDAALIAELGLDTYRFSIAWPRIQPDGRGPVNERGLDHYRRVVDALLERGVAPNVTLYHWDLPQALEDAGGWSSRETALRFADYAEIVYRALHDRVGTWATLNEPWCSAFLGYLTGEHAPGVRDPRRAVAAIHHLNLAHGLAIRAMRPIDARPRLGIVLNLAPIRTRDGSPPATASLRDGIRLTDGLRNRVWLDPILEGRYPADIAAHAESFGGLPVEDGDLATIAAPIDWLGVNYYHDDTLGDPAPGSPPPSGPSLHRGIEAVVWDPPDGPRTDQGWIITPDGLRAILVAIGRDHPGAPPLYVSENGAAYDDPIGPDGRIRDERRIAYLAAHLESVHRAIEEGADVRGYIAWSLLDNFEWAWGYDMRFGIVHVDYATQQRTPRDSAFYLRDVARANALP